jgi:hypothetical protein
MHTLWVGFAAGSFDTPQGTSLYSYQEKSYISKHVCATACHDSIDIRVQEFVQVANDEEAKNMTSLLPFLQYIKSHM